MSRTAAATERVALTPLGHRDFTAVRGDLVHSIYTLTGPSGIYVGCTARPEIRARTHFSTARREPGCLDQPLHRAMRRDGVETWRFELVAQAHGFEAGRDMELELIEQLLDEGAHLLNERPRALLRLEEESA